MRVVHLSTIHRPLDVRIFYKECRSLAATGCEVHLVVSHPTTNKQDGVFFHAIDRVTNVSRLERTWRRLKSTYTIAASLQADIYHFHDPELIPIGIMLQRLGAKVVYDVHEDTPWEAISIHKNNPLIGWTKFGMWSVLEEIAKASLDGFICVTPKIAQKFPSTKTTLVRNFPLISELKTTTDISLDYNTRPNNIIYAGGITEIRAIREIVLAMDLLPQELGAKLLLLGEFSPLTLQTEIEQFPGWEKVEFLGWQSREQMLPYLAKSKLGLVIFHPERDHIEALPNKLFEYMAAGLPIIASNFPLWRQLIEEIGCGLLVNPLEPKEIFSAIQYILEHAEEAAAMGKRGQEAVRMQYNWEIESQKLLTFYQTLQQI